jgi:hypothetical protein
LFVVAGELTTCTQPSLLARMSQSWSPTRHEDPDIKQAISAAPSSAASEHTHDLGVAASEPASQINRELVEELYLLIQLTPPTLRQP